MKLIDYIKKQDKRLAFPLIGYPGMKINNTNAFDNLTKADNQYDTILKINDRFNPDILMTFMDLSVEAEAIGLKINFNENDAPDVSEHPVKDIDELKKLKVPDINNDGRFSVFIEVVKKLKENTDKLVGGYCASPFTLAGLLMGAENLAINTVMGEDFCEAVLQFCTKVVINYVKALEKAGADFIVPLEPTGVLLSPDLFKKFINPYFDQIADAVDIPLVLHVCGQTTPMIDTMCKTKAQALSLDSMVIFEEVIKKVPDDMILIGNIAPVEVMLDLSENEVYEKTTELLKKLKGYDNFILSTGCDLPPAVKLENVDMFMKAVYDFNDRKEEYY